MIFIYLHPENRYFHFSLQIDGFIFRLSTTDFDFKTTAVFVFFPNRDCFSLISRKHLFFYLFPNNGSFFLWTLHFFYFAESNGCFLNSQQTMAISYFRSFSCLYLQNVFLNFLFDNGFHSFHLRQQLFFISLKGCF